MVNDFFITIFFLFQCFIVLGIILNPFLFICLFVFVLLVFKDLDVYGINRAAQYMTCPDHIAQEYDSILTEAGI